MIPKHFKINVSCGLNFVLKKEEQKVEKTKANSSKCPPIYPKVTLSTFQNAFNLAERW